MRLPRLFTGAALCLAALLAGTGIAAAKDAVQAGVTIPTGEPVPVMAENGNGYTPGTYAVGTIILNYTYIGATFPAGAFATFNLNLNVYDPASPKNDPTYPVDLTLSDIGSKHLALSPSSPFLSVTGMGWTSTTPVTVIIPSEVATNPDFMQDGAQIVGNLKMATPGGSQLDTVTNVIVKITLVHPTGPCVKAYNFITDAQLTDTITASEVNVNTRHRVTSTNPYGSLSSNALIVNACGAPVTFDLKMVLDASFSTQPSNNPGNAVFTFATAGEIDPAVFNIASFGASTGQGQNLCLQNVTVPDGSSFLDAVHMSINNGMSDSALPADQTFDFSATLYNAGSSCSGPLFADAAPNPATATLTFTTK